MLLRSFTLCYEYSPLTGYSSQGFMDFYNARLCFSIMKIIDISLRAILVCAIKRFVEPNRLDKP